MSKSVDVLAVLQRMEIDAAITRMHDHNAEEESEAVTEALAAVAELIEANKEYDAAFDARIGSHWLENESRELFNAAAKRRTAALARVQGESP